MDLITLGVDLAKNVFQLHGVDDKGVAVLTKRLSRKALLPYVAQLPQCLIVVEACSSAHYWCRQFEKLGHQTKMISPQFVRPYVKYHKNDSNDAMAIVEAGTRPCMNFVPKKSIEQQDIQSQHRVRSRLVRQRTALVNQIRGLLAEYGLVIPKRINFVRKQLLDILEDAENELTVSARQLFFDLREELMELDKKIARLEKRLKQLFLNNASCQRLGTIPGVGMLTATAVLATVGDVSVFKNGRHFAAYLGLIPRQQSSGDRRQLLGISKRGDVYLRTLLVHGARSALRVSSKKTDRTSLWVMNLKARKNENIACVALANKNARTIWALLAKQKDYQVEHTIAA